MSSESAKAAVVSPCYAGYKYEELPLSFDVVAPDSVILPAGRFILNVYGANSKPVIEDLRSGKHYIFDARTSETSEIIDDEIFVIDPVNATNAPQPKKSAFKRLLGI